MIIIVINRRATVQSPSASPPAVALLTNGGKVADLFEAVVGYLLPELAEDAGTDSRVHRELIPVDEDVFAAVDSDGTMSASLAFVGSDDRGRVIVRWCRP